MPKFLLNRWHGLHMVWTFIAMLLMILVLFLYEWFIGALALFVSVVLVFYTIRAEKAFRKDFKNYVGTLSHRVKKAGDKVINELPIGVLLYNENQVIEWHNPFVAKMLGQTSLIEQSLLEVFPTLEEDQEEEIKRIEIGEQIYEVVKRPEERLLFFTDKTAYTKLFQSYHEEKIVLGIVMLDNLEEATQGMDDQTRSILLARITGQITEWSQKNNVYLRRTAVDKFIIILNQKSLESLEESRFEIIDEIRDTTVEYKVPFTLSIGVATGADSFVELGEISQTSLDMALGRGGDQAAVKVGERLSFYGGRSNAVEKRTRVRARVISHALRDLIHESDNVVIMGHKIPDMDSIGAAIGVLKTVQLSNKDGYIILEGTNPSIKKLMEAVSEDDQLQRWFISPEEAYHIMNQRTLIVVVDTHKIGMIAEPKLLQFSDRIVVIDHHRRGEDMIQDPTLVYIEPYASSTCELVTELLQYFNERMTMEIIESTALLAGIIVDTKSFALRTGARTFEAASFLRRHGADLSLIQTMMKEDLNVYVEKAEIIKNVQILYNYIALSVTKPEQKTSQLIIAQVADTLLNMTDIKASFVISERPDGIIGISARSLGQINVQVIMERLGGGGHLSNAATQLEGTLQEAEQKLKEVLKEMEMKEGLFE